MCKNKAKGLISGQIGRSTECQARGFSVYYTEGYLEFTEMFKQKQITWLDKLFKKQNSSSNGESRMKSERPKEKGCLQESQWWIFSTMLFTE